MEIVAHHPHPHPHPNLLRHHLNISLNYNNKHILSRNLDSINHFIPKILVQTHFPLHRPELKPPTPINLKPPPKISNAKPITTTSDILHLMDALKFSIPWDIYSLLIKECTKLRDPSKAIELHTHIRKDGFRLNLPFLNRILLMYVTCGCFENARQLFDQMFVRDFNSWAVMIAGVCENGNYNEAINLFTKMLSEEEFGDLGVHKIKFSVTGILVCVLKACVSKMDLEIGMQVHGWLWKMGYSKNAVISSSLINFYGKLKCFNCAHSVFEQVCSRNTAVWTARIVNCCSDGNFEGAVNVFKDMGKEGVRKNSYTFSSVFKACGRIRDIEFGRQVHANAKKLGLETDGYVQCALVDMYGKYGLLHDAAKMYEVGRNQRNGACCNAMLANYVQKGLSIEAIKIVNDMKAAGLEPHESLFDEVRLVCGSRSYGE